MSKKTIIILFFSLLFSLSHAENIKELKALGKISSMQHILSHLPDYDIKRLLEIELKKKKSARNNQQYIYEIEYINSEGIVLEIEVDALSAQVLHLERENN